MLDPAEIFETQMTPTEDMLALQARLDTATQLLRQTYDELQAQRLLNEAAHKLVNQYHSRHHGTWMLLSYIRTHWAFRFLSKKLKTAVKETLSSAV